MSYEGPTNRVDIIDQQRKRQQKISEALDWRSSEHNRLEDFDSHFKTIVKAEKQRREQQVKQGGTQLTLEQIDARVRRMDIIQQSVKAGTYTDPQKPWNRYYRWIEDGEPTK